MAKEREELERENESLRARVNELELIVHSLPHMLFLKDTENNILRVNQTVADSHGVSPDDMANTPSHQWYPKEAAQYYEDDKEVIQSKQPKVNIIEPIELGNNQRHWVRTSKIPLFDEENNVSALLVLAQDITQLMQTQEELARSESFLESILENIPHMIFVKDAKELRFVRFNKAGEELLGYDRSDLLGKNDYDFFPAEQADFFTAKDREVLAQSDIVNIEKEPIETAKGSRILRTKKIPITSAEGEPLYLLGMSEDITDRIETEEELSKTRAALKNAQVGTARLDTQGNYVAVDAVYAGMIGYQVEELIGVSWEVTVLERDLPISYQAYETMKQDGHAEAEVVALRKDGSQFYKRVVMVPDLDDGGEFVGHYCFMTDIDARMKSQEQIREVSQRALQATKAKSEFVANMSHEIRTPMNGVIGVTDLLLDTDLSDEQEEYAQIIKASARSLLGIINDILDFSKIEAGKIEFSKTCFDIREVLHRLEQMLAVEIDANSIEYAMAVANAVPRFVVGDPNRLRQILVNLLANSMKFTPRSGAVVLFVEVEERLAERCILRFSVSDTGIGIPDVKQDAIFEPFSQADNTSSRRFGGTGLGLSICDRLVRQMNGSMWVRSREGVGSVFSFTAEFKPGSEAEYDVAQSALRNKPTRAAVGPPLRILLAEDNEINAHLARKILEKAGHTVLHASNGKQAVELFSCYDVDLVLMDIQMPILDGLDATQEIRKMEKGRNIPIVALTAHAMKDERERFLAMGLDGHVTKPIDRSELFNALRLATHE